MDPKPPVDWAEVECAYADRGMTVSEICALFRIPKSTLYRHIGLQGWTLRNTGKRTIRWWARGDGIKMDRDLVNRLRHLLEWKIRCFEERMENNEVVTGTENERELRAMTAIAGMISRLSGHMGRGEHKGPADADQGEGGKDLIEAGNGDADLLRRDLAQRLDQLRESGDP